MSLSTFDAYQCVITFGGVTGSVSSFGGDSAAFLLPELPAEVEVGQTVTVIAGSGSGSFTAEATIIEISALGNFAVYDALFSKGFVVALQLPSTASASWLALLNQGTATIS